MEIGPRFPGLDDAIASGKRARKLKRNVKCKSRTHFHFPSNTKIIFDQRNVNYIRPSFMAFKSLLGSAPNSLWIVYM